MPSVLDLCKKGLKDFLHISVTKIYPKGNDYKHTICIIRILEYKYVIYTSSSEGTFVHFVNGSDITR